MVALDQERLSLGLVLQGLRHTIDRLELEFARWAVEFAEGTEWRDEGFNTPADWMRFNCHMTSTAAWRAITVGEQQEELPSTGQTLRDGDIGYAHLAVMAQTRKAVGEDFNEAKLLPLAVESSPGKFHYQCLHYRHSLDAKAYSRAQEDLHEGRSLRLNTAQDGCLLISGVLDSVGGAAVRSALEPLARPSGAHDHRSREQRLADALYERVAGGVPASLQVTAFADTLLGHPGAPAAETEFTLPVSANTVQRLACDCSLTRVLLDADSMVIDVGRATRKIPVALRKALNLRDRHCRWPGCERTPSYCDGHHLTHWIFDGPTDLDNVVLLCKRHHRMVHEGGWQLVKSEGELVTVAPTVVFGWPRGPDLASVFG